MATVGAPNHMPRRVPAPTAPLGTLLELIQLARRRDAERHAGSNTHVKRARDLCLEAAETHKALLEATWGRLGLRSYVLNCAAPWEGLWPQVAKAIGVEP